MELMIDGLSGLVRQESRDKEGDGGRDEWWNDVVDFGNVGW